MGEGSVSIAIIIQRFQKFFVSHLVFTSINWCLPVYTGFCKPVKLISYKRINTTEITKCKNI